ncbi:M20/M25/M40 family metallo-hydrolase [uncultured Sphingopyxis sp.]|uniref:M20/M25/M40 family metallo-hydrolase n=1 Tax=uncultured Sphingopyxis sp. TaxID=310581 RepID=UPI0025DD110A|nr:M20/M25/M40 family metallo-hydrolase [uncultured Sphingopyxis sp.]
MSAHLDTVFPEGTDVKVKERDGRLHGPGLGDDARGLAVVIAVARAFQESKIATLGDILFVGTVGEEGEGDLRGVKAIVRDNPAIDGFISIDGIDLSRIVSRGTASRRWRIEFSGEGGHSFLDFGRPSAVHAMGRAIAAIGDIVPPTEPRTTFTVGVAKGGTSVNAIAGKATIEIDLRSDSGENLTALEGQAMAAVDAGVAAENRRWNSNRIAVTRTLIGDRPGGATPDNSNIVQVALAAARIGGAVPKLANSSTDSNVPIAHGIPAITLPGGGEGGDFHSLGEWYRPVDPWIGAQRAALTVLALVGVDGAGEPLLQKRAAPGE